MRRSQKDDNAAVHSPSMSPAVDACASNIHHTPGCPYPDGPGWLARVRAGDLFRLNPLPSMTANARHYGDLVHQRAFGRHIFQVNHPELVQECLVNHARLHHRGIVMQKARLVLGEGLLSSEDPHHLRQRRLAQPAFHRDRITAYGRTIGDYAEQTTGEWLDGQTRDVHRDMQLLSLRIVGKTLFDAELREDKDGIAAALANFMAFVPLAVLPGSDLMLRLPIPLMRRIRRSRHDLDTLVYGLIRRRREEGLGADTDRGDLLSMLMRSQDTEGDTGGMSDRQLRDECVTVMLAGNETTANGLAFALWLLARHPEAQQRLQAEASAVLEARSATTGDYASLPFAYACFAEAMRVYPPAWTLARTAAEDYRWRGVTIRRGSLLLTPQWVLHRDPRFFPEPEQFRPERFLPGAKEARPRFAYFPFGTGGRQCIGEGLAWMEGVLVLATIARDWTLSVPPGTPEKLRLDAKITLRPLGGISLTLQRRT